MDRIYNGRAVFLDRDGTIIEEVNFLHEPEKVRLISGAAEALVRLRDAGFRLIVTTNQSGVARGLFTEEQLIAVNDELERQLRAAGAGIDEYYYCPHHPDFGCTCNCRKPSSGMVDKAAEKYGVDVAGSYFFGDKASDIEFARTCGGKAVLVLTGYGSGETDKLRSMCIEPDKVCESINEAADWAIEDSKKS
ncbi:MAG TPA: HAD family hydrolase [Nitrospirota bacterium]|jgi:histidinol-phosphate phosphatase family protein